MEYFLFILNIMLTTAFATSVASAYYLYRVRGGKVFITLALLFCLYFADNFLVFMTEVIPSFEYIYDMVFSTSPFFKAFIHIGVVACYAFIHKQILREKFTSIDYVLLIFYAMVLFTVGLIPNKAVSSWAFFLPTQLFNGGLAIYGLIRIKTYPHGYRRAFYKLYRYLAIFTIIFNALIIAEDTFVIFNIDDYTLGSSGIFNRNITENIMVLFYAVNLLRFTKLVLIHHDVNVFGSVLIPPKNIISTMDAFCHINTLTERERDVLTELLDGRSILEISEKLFISSGTVKTHIHNLYRKVDVGKKSELVRKYNSFESELQKSDK